MQKATCVKFSRGCFVLSDITVSGIVPFLLNTEFLYLKITYINTKKVELIEMLNISGIAQ